MFDYTSLNEQEAYRGTVGIPRVLNMYEHYPFWHTYFTNLGYKVVLSDESSKEIYTKGMDSIPSESACYPAKLAHGHIENLLHKKPDFIFYPCIPYDIKESKASNNNFACPIVTSYPETIHANMESVEKSPVNFMKPFLPLDMPKRMESKLYDLFKTRRA